MHIGEKIKQIRLEKHITQKVLGERCDMPDSQIRQYESGKITPKIQQIARIAAGLGVSTEYLLEGTDQSFSSYDVAAMGEKLFKSLPEYVSSEEYKQRIIDSILHTIENFTPSDTTENKKPKKFKAVFRFEEIEKRRTALNAAFDKLNEDGQKIAVDQVELLTEIPKYQKGSDSECPASQNAETPTGSESATDATPPENK